MAAGALDTQGVWQYGEDDPLSPFSTLLNLLAASASSAIAAKAVGGMAAGYAQITASSTTYATGAITATPVDVPGLAVTVNVPAGRRIKLTFDGQAYSSVAADRGQVGIREGSTLLTYSTNAIPAAALGFSGFHCEVILTPTAGAHTYKISVGRQSGSGNLSVAAGAQLPAFILAEDIGPAR